MKHIHLPGLLALALLAGCSVTLEPDEDLTSSRDSQVKSDSAPAPDTTPIPDTTPDSVTSTLLDLILVVDESGSMLEERQALVKAIDRVLDRAAKQNVDIRVGVTGVDDTGTLGKLCSRASSDPKDDGGTDRFLKSAERALIHACIENPPYQATAIEHTLKNGEAAVKSHLPRKVGDPARIRPGARLVLVFLTDEMSHEIKTLVPKTVHQCVLDSASQSSVDQAVHATVDLFKGASNPEAKTTAHLVGGVCSSACSAEIGHGMMAVVKATGGGVVDICLKDLATSVLALLKL